MGVKERKMKGWGGDVVKMTSTLVIELSLKIMRQSRKLLICASA